MWRSEPAPAQTTGCRTSVRSTRTTGTRSSGNGRYAARLEPGRLDHFRRFRDGRATRTCEPRDLRAVGAPVARDEHDHGRSVADEDEGLHDLPERAADGVRRCFGRGRLRAELLDPRLGARRAEKRRDALDRLRPPGHQ